MKKRLVSWLPAAALALLILTTGDVAVTVRKDLAERFGSGIFNLAYAAVAAAVLSAAFSVIRNGKRPAFRLLLLFMLGLTWAFSLYKLKIGVEKIHYVEYGLLGVLGFSAFAKDFGAPSAAFLSILFVYLTGIADEFLQHFNPLRVAEFGDVYLNVKAGLFGVLFMGVLRAPSSLKMTFRRNDAGIALAGLLLSAAAAFFFLEQVHGYGYFIGETGGGFYSGFDAPELESVGRALKGGGTAAPEEKRIYADEAARHKFQRDFYLANKFYYGKDLYYIDYGKALGENGILENHYGAYLDSCQCRWDGATVAFVRGQATVDRAWHSRVKETIITAFPRAWVRGFFIGLIVLLSGAVILVFRRPKQM
jgi:hypothetical protein